MYVYFDVDERSMLRFRDRHRATLRNNDEPRAASHLKVPLFVGLSNEEGFSHEGIIDFADNRVDSSTGTIQVRGKLDNRDRLFKPGLFARVRVPVSDGHKALMVAEPAIGTDQGQKFVLVVNEQKLVERRLVTLGSLQDDGLRVIPEGLKPGEWIVVNGLQRARPGKPVTPQEAPMPTRRVQTPPNGAGDKATGDSSKPTSDGH